MFYAQLQEDNSNYYLAASGDLQFCYHACIHYLTLYFLQYYSAST